ncbi:MAG: hypothetical protein EXR96_05265 [Nitrospiraceae bacterium]|nr:hypothetical protein [Nitrospiraceae bacterium]
MRTTDTLSMIEHPFIRQTLAALIMAGTLLAIPTPVAADSKKEVHQLHPVSPVIHGLMARSRIIEQAPPAKDQKHVPRTTPLRKQLKGLPKHNILIELLAGLTARLRRGFVPGIALQPDFRLAINGNRLVI